jgi:hypothetical protein
LFDIVEFVVAFVGISGVMNEAWLVKAVDPENDRHEALF